MAFARGDRPSGARAGERGHGLGERGAERAYHLTVILIALMVLAILVVETLYGVAENSRFLIRDGLEWVYDVLIYCFAAMAFGRGAAAERRASLGSAVVLAAAGVETVGQIVWTFFDPPEVDVEGITISGALTIAEAIMVAAALFRFRRARNPIIEATWLSARNDVLSSTLSALVTMAARFAPTSWPQMLVDALGAFLCIQAAYVVARDAWRLE